MKSLTDAFTLINGCEIPCVGFGTWRVQGGETAVNAVSKALQAGYRHIDTAAYYKNEDSVGEAVRKCGIAREEVFITSKVWDRGYKEALSSFDRALNKLQMDYIDLYLIHWPANAKVYKNWQEVNAGTWQALVEMYKKGRAKAIGVSNFLPHHLEPLMGFDDVPMVNQIEYHPGYMQKETVDYCRKKTSSSRRGAPSEAAGCSPIPSLWRSRKSTANRWRRFAFAGACKTARSPFQGRLLPDGLRKTQKYLTLR